MVAGTAGSTIVARTVVRACPALPQAQLASQTMSGKIIVSTGVTRGLGRAMTEEFIKCGHTVAGCGRSAEQIAELQKQFAKPHDFESLDVASDEQVAAW